MALIPLRLGSLTAEGFRIVRSGIRWLCEEGHACRPGEVVAYCNIALAPSSRQAGGPPIALPFAEELHDFQAAFAVKARGTLRKSGASSHGGFLDRRPTHDFWAPDFVIGHLETSADDGALGDNEGNLHLLMVCGRRKTDLAEVRSGLLTGWHDRSRAWWGEQSGKRSTLLSLGVCEQVGVARGEANAFLELFDAVTGPAHAVFIADDSLVPCSRVLTEQLQRTPAANAAIAADFLQSFAAGELALSGKGWIFAGALLSALQGSPLTERYPILTRRGLSEIGPADAVLLSLNAEPPTIHRHRRLGYTVSCHRFRLAGTGPAIRAWWKNNFETVRRTIDDIRQDYCAFIDAVRARSDTKFLIMNSMSTSGSEIIHNYSSYELPMGNTLASFHRKEMNLMLHDLAREKGVSIVDVDAIAGELGAGAHLPDGVHASGALQSELRDEIVHILSGAGLAGFTERRVM